jgi:hypothetical protein
VNGTSAVVPLSVINHLGGRILISESTFTSISLGAQPLISYSGLDYIIVVFIFLRVYIYIY